MASIKKNFGYQLGYQILISILPFVTSPYISRVLGAEGIGAYSYTYSVVTYFKIFAALGIVNYGNRLIAKVKDEQEKLNRTFSSLFVLHLILSGFSMVCYILYCLFVVQKNKVIALIQVIYLLAEMLDINWFFFGMEKFKLTVIRNSFIKIVTMLSVFGLVKTEADLWKYVLILAVGTLFSSTAVWIFLPRYARFTRFTIQEMLVHIKPMLILFFAVIAISIFSYMDKIMLGAMSSMSQLGFYENAWKMIEFPAGLVTALGTVMLPKMSNLIARGNEEKLQRYIYESMRFSLFAAGAIAFGVAGISKEFSVLFWGSEFVTSGKIMMVMSPVIVIIAFNAVIRTQYLIPKEYDKIYLCAVVVGAITNFVINLLLIPDYGAIGASVATVFSYIVIWIVQTVFAYRNICLTECIVDSVPYMLIAAIMFCGIKILSSRLEVSTLAVILEIGLGIILYGGVSLLYAYIKKDKFILNKIKMMR